MFIGQLGHGGSDRTEEMPASTKPDGNSGLPQLDLRRKLANPFS